MPLSRVLAVTEGVLLLVAWLAATAAPGIHFEDYPELQGYYLPEWSHMTRAEAERFTAALYGEITLAHGAVEQHNFPDYPVVRLADCPAIEVHLIESDAPLGGGGEPGTPPVAPAVTNAIFAATGIRIRELPISKHSLKKDA